jgi:hypothetical protein
MWVIDKTADVIKQSPEAVVESLTDALASRDALLAQRAVLLERATAGGGGAAAPHSRPKRRTGDQLSKISDKLAALAGKKCSASYIWHEHGDVFMILMTDGCPACVEAKRQLQARRQQTEARPVPPAPTPAPHADDKRADD